MPPSAAINIRQLLRQACARIDRGDAEHLLAHALERDRAWLFAHATDIAEASAVARFDALVACRAHGEPVAYLTGRRGFWTLDLEVTPATLIPRPETELLVEEALRRLPREGAVTLADLGTGSGAVALAVATERPLARVVATDASEAALAVARRNARQLGVRNVEWLHGDWLAPLAGRHFGVIVSNPPYIADDDPHLQLGDLRFEPTDALAAGADGLDAIRSIVRAALDHLDADGWLLLEHGWQQGEAVRVLLRDAGYVDIVTARDLEDRERVTVARCPARHALSAAGPPRAACDGGA